MRAWDREARLRKIERAAEMGLPEWRDEELLEKIIVEALKDGKIEFGDAETIERAMTLLSDRQPTIEIREETIRRFLKKGVGSPELLRRFTESIPDSSLRAELLALLEDEGGAEIGEGTLPEVGEGEPAESGLDGGRGGLRGVLHDILVVALEGRVDQAKDLKKTEGLRAAGFFLLVSIPFGIRNLMRWIYKRFLQKGIRPGKMRDFFDVAFGVKEFRKKKIIGGGRRDRDERIEVATPKEKEKEEPKVDLTV